MSPGRVGTASSAARVGVEREGSGGDHARLTRALLEVADLPDPPLRFVAGSDAIATAEDKGREITE